MEPNIKYPTVVDVRTPQEYDVYHFPDAINIPLDQLQQRLGEFKQMDTPILVYCRSGARSGMAAAILKQNGITDVHNGGGLDTLLQNLN